MFPEGTPGSMAIDRDSESSRSPVILSLEQAEDMERKMNSVLVKIQHLK
ncbi:hypothetical protein chiPu_0031899, partial [Chiloscyllium punctatum]|nr:hypothetical protein [Chiloscyllium punctatum]